LIALASIATALPLEIEERQIRNRTGIIENQFSHSRDCGKFIFVWARGSREAGNMGSIIGQPLGDVLRREYGGDLMIEGIDYPATLSANFLPGGTDRASATLMRNTFTDINIRCPNSVVLAGGYSQGAAVVHRSIEDLPQNVKDQIVRVVTFGDTQRRADNDQIPSFPMEKLKIFCGDPLYDTVCDGNLSAAVLPPHLAYGLDADEAGQFLIGKGNAVL
ncbi:carbohydrate esterase family 5 protein, partial [Periconia macrospinosa]